MEIGILSLYSPPYSRTRHRVGVFAAMLRCLEVQTLAIALRIILRALLARHLLELMRDARVVVFFHYFHHASPAAIRDHSVHKKANAGVGYVSSWSSLPLA